MEYLFRGNSDLRECIDFCHDTDDPRECGRDESDECGDYHSCSSYDSCHSDLTCVRDGGCIVD